LPELKSQRKLIHETDWDVLIILDACRYDFFEKTYVDYLGGKLRRVRSGARHTGEWLAKTFKGYYPNIAYISGMPHVNSLGLALSDSHDKWEYDWKATDHFPKIIDVWDFGWSEKLGAVPPKILNEVTHRVDGKRKIVHYNQPHAPYLSLVEEKGVSRDKWNPKGESGKPNKFRRFIGKKIRKVLGTELFWELRKFLRLPTGVGLEMAWRVDKLEYYYKDNLRRVMKAVSDLIGFLDGKTVVTADHGECLGERGYWSHGYDGPREIPKMPVLIEVPWLEIES